MFLIVCCYLIITLWDGVSLNYVGLEWVAFCFVWVVCACVFDSFYVGCV